MAEIISIKAQPRELLGSANTRRLRREGLVPAVLYGKKRTSHNLAFDAAVLQAAMSTTERVFNIEMPGGDVESVLVKEIQYDALTDEIRHMDLGRVDLSERIEVKVALKFTGTPIGLKTGGKLETMRHDVTLMCRADSVPSEVRVDTSGLDINQTLRVKDMTLPEGSEPVTNPEAMLMSCKKTAEEEDEAATGEEGPAEPEVIAKGKKEEDGAEAS